MLRMVRSIHCVNLVHFHEVLVIHWKSEISQFLRRLREYLFCAQITHICSSCWKTKSGHNCKATHADYGDISFISVASKLLKIFVLQQISVTFFSFPDGQVGRLISSLGTFVRIQGRAGSSIIYVFLILTGTPKQRWLRPAENFYFAWFSKKLDGSWFGFDYAKISGFISNFLKNEI